jgi:hypothetical protein
MTTTSAALVPIQPAFTDAERLALAGFLAGYRGLTREAYALDLRQFTTWCRTCSVALFAVRRADIESFARDLEGRGRARATVTRRLCTIAGFYKYAVEEELLDHSPAAHVRRPRVDYESRAVALDRNELGALPVAAGLGPPGEHALRDADDLDVVYLHYDDLKADLEGQMRQMAARLGIDVDEHRWPRLVQAATFESMRSRADTTVPAGGPEHWIDPAAFFSRGTSGQWRDLLDDADLARYAARVRALASHILVEWVHREPID